MPTLQAIALEFDRNSLFNFDSIYPSSAYAVNIPNNSIETSGKPWQNYKISIAELENELNNSSNLDDLNYDFLSEIKNERVKQSLRTTGMQPSFSSSLLADIDSKLIDKNYKLDGIFDTAIRHDSINKYSSPQINISTDSSSKVGTTELGVLQFNSSQISPFKIGTTETSFSQVSPTQISTTQNGFVQIYTPQTSTAKISSTQVGLKKTFSFKVHTRQISSAKISSDEVSRMNLRPSKISTSQIDFVEIIANSLNPKNHTISKILVSSSIAFEQFVNSNTYPFHNSTPEIINKLNNSATNIWSDLLQSETQLDIDFQITDLPKGQLAEATITGFDDNGTPNAGTILIDHDANGIGWFIDETPLNNSEFTAQNTDSYLLAATESEANGKYNLLTTVLHELAHRMGLWRGIQGLTLLCLGKGKRKKEKGKKQIPLPLTP